MANDAELAPVEAWLRGLQDRICAAIEALDGSAPFVEDTWTRPEGGGGRTRVLRDGAVFEQAGIGFSRVEGARMPASATAHRPELAGKSWVATGVSLVFHPRNPYVPTTHMNVRVFRAEGDGATVWWFGGGYDLTPYYVFEDDARHWHATARAACAPFGAEVYPAHKRWCDEYFFLKHRNETRGIGGVFFDDLNRWDFDTCFAYQRAIGDSFLAAYTPIVERRRDTFREPAITSHLVEAHRAVFLSLVRRDPDAAESRLREHFKIGDDLRRKNLFTTYQSQAREP